MQLQPDGKIIIGGYFAITVAYEYSREGWPRSMPAELRLLLIRRAGLNNFPYCVCQRAVKFLLEARLRH
jgi:hypothetical protein